MEKYDNIVRISLFVVVVFLLSPAFSQEYDDMYFTKSDRKKINFDLKVNTKDSEMIIKDFENDDWDESYLDKNVNPEYIAKYKVQSNDAMANNQKEEYYYSEEAAQNSYFNGGSYNNSGFRNAPYASASVKINYISRFGFPAYNNVFIYNDRFGSFWIQDTYVYSQGNGYRGGGYGSYYNSYDPFYNPYDPFNSFYRSSSYASNYFVRSVNYYCPPAYSYNTVAGNTALYDGYQEVRRTVVKGPRGSSGSQIVLRGVEENNSGRRSYSGLANDRTQVKAKEIGYQQSQNELEGRSLNKTVSAQAFSRANSIETQSRQNSSRNATYLNRSYSPVTASEPTFVGGERRGDQFGNTTTRRYDTNNLPSRNAYNIPNVGSGQGLVRHQNGTQKNSYPTAIDNTNKNSRGYTPSSSTPASPSRSYTAPSGSSSGGRSTSGSSSRSGKN